MTTQNHQTDEALDRMLAKLNGWTEERIEAASELAKSTSEYRRLPRKDSFSGWALADKIEALERKGAEPIPRYTQSLDECARVEAGLKGKPQLDAYEINLRRAVFADDKDEYWKPNEESPKTRHFMASPKQRTIALIQTLQSTP